jgi:hypothetical protein
MYVYGRNLLTIRQDDVDRGQLLNWIEKLDSHQMTNLELVMPSGRLAIFSSPQERMHVSFSNGIDQAGFILDRRQPKDVYLNFPLYDGQNDLWRMYETVSKPIAMEVASFFLENDALPSNYEWDGYVLNFK